MRGLAKKGDDGVCDDGVCDDGAGEEPTGLACGAYLGDDAGGTGDDMVTLCEAGFPTISMCVLGRFFVRFFCCDSKRDQGRADCGIVGPG